MEDNNKKYFAQLPQFSNELGDELMSKIRNYYHYIEESGLKDLWFNLFDQYYGGDNNDGLLSTMGTQGEFKKVSLNHFKSVLNTLHTMITNQRPSFQAIASNSDYKSQAQTVLANSLLDWVLKDKQLEQKAVDAAQSAIILGESFIHYGWDPNKGEDFDVDDNGQPVKEGDLFIEHILPTDCIREPKKKSFEENSWVILRTTANKYDLAAQYPDQANRILDNDKLQNSSKRVEFDLNDITHSNEEDVYLYRLLHKKTPAVPEGRLVEFLDAETILIDTQLPYENINVEQLKADLRLDSQHGTTIAIDLLQVQQLRDNLVSSIASNQAAFSVQSILFPEGWDGEVDAIAKGLRAIYYDPQVGAPTPLQLTSTPPEVFTFVDQLGQEINLLSGVNSTSRGAPPKQVSSGTAMAMLISTSMEFNKKLERSYVRMLENLGTGIIDLFKTYASIPRVALISGKANNYQLKEFKGEDLQEIRRVTATIGSPFTRSIAGKAELADKFLANGLIKNINDYFLVLETGKLENFTDSEVSNSLMIRAENEQLADPTKEIPPVLSTDQHREHILEHLTLLNSPENRSEPELIERTLGHIQEHLQEWRNADPAILMVSGQQPIPPELNQPQLPQGLNVGDVLSTQDPIKEKAATVNAPNLPNAPQGSSPEVQQQVEEMKKRLED